MIMKLLIQTTIAFSLYQRQPRRITVERYLLAAG